MRLWASRPSERPLRQVSLASASGRQRRGLASSLFGLIQQRRYLLGAASRRGRSVVPVVTPAPLLAVKSTQGLPAPGRSEGYLELIVAGGIIRVHGRIEAPSLSVALECLARQA